MTRITVVIPTIGRPTLTNTLVALAPQLNDGDRVMVMCDNLALYNFVCTAVEMVQRNLEPQGTWRVYSSKRPLGAFGHRQRNRALDLLCKLEDRPDWVWSIDDDDEPAFGALDFIRARIRENGHRLLIFKMRYGAGHPANGLVLPQRQQIAIGDVGTPMIVAPLSPAEFGLRSTDSVGREHGEGYCGDYEYAVALREEFGEPVWCDEVIAEIRPVEQQTIVGDDAA